MSEIGHNGGPILGEDFELIPIERGTKLWEGILSYIEKVSAGVFKILIPTHYIKQGEELSFKTGSDTYTNFSIEHDGGIKVHGVTTCVPQGWYEKEIKQAA